MKQCRTCEVWKGERSYSVNKKNKLDGLNTECRECSSIRSKRNKAKIKDKLAAYAKDYHATHREKRANQKLEWQKKNPDKKSAQDKRYRARHKEKVDAKVREYAKAHAEEIREYQKKYQIENKEAIKRVCAEWRKRNPEIVRRNSAKTRSKNRLKCNARSRDWARKHPKKILSYVHTRRARKRSAPGTYTDAEFQALCTDCGNICLRCGQLAPLTVDHVIPLSKGGSNDISNLQPLCKSCNSSKGTKSTDYRGCHLNRRSLA